MGDKVSFGLTAKMRGVWGYDDVVNYNSAAYRYGGYAGQAVNIGLMMASPMSIQALTGGAEKGVRTLYG